MMGVARRPSFGDLPMTHRRFCRLAGIVLASACSMTYIAGCGGGSRETGTLVTTDPAIEDPDVNRTPSAPQKAVRKP